MGGKIENHLHIVNNMRCTLLWPCVRILLVYCRCVRVLLLPFRNALRNFCDGKKGRLLLIWKISFSARHAIHVCVNCVYVRQMIARWCDFVVLKGSSSSSPITTVCVHFMDIANVGANILELASVFSWVNTLIRNHVVIIGPESVDSRIQAKTVLRFIYFH